MGNELKENNEPAEEKNKANVTEEENVPEKSKDNKETEKKDSSDKTENTNSEEKSDNQNNIDDKTQEPSPDEEISKSLEVTEEGKKEFEEKQQQIRELPVFGRKVFFLNPPLSISSFVMDNLKEEQYEVYKITDYKVAKPILRMSPNAICFIFIDDLLPLRGWYNFIQSFQDDDSLKSIFLGVISERIRPKDKENFLMNLRLPGGFISLGGAIVDVLRNLEGILKINGAKGQRQYVKLNCSGLTNINGYLADGFRLYQFDITNISTAGISLKMNKSQGYNFAKNTVIDNLCVNLNRKTVVCSGLIFDVKQAGDDCYAVILFTKQTSVDQRKSIRNFIFETLTNKFEILQKNTVPEMFNYIHNEAEGTETEKTDEKLNSPEGDVVLNEVEEAEEVKDNKDGKDTSDNAESKDTSDNAESKDTSDNAESKDTSDNAESKDDSNSDSEKKSETDDNKEQNDSTVKG